MLTLYKTYSREDAHRIFASGTPFRRGSGSWGNHGRVEIPDRPGDWVFFVTYGQRVGTHLFDESITADGVLSWQSNPTGNLSHSYILDWINHDETLNSIYLFLRTSENRPYAYLGKLKYVSHDAERQNPVHFQWQILDWNITEEQLRSIDLTLVSSKIEGSPAPLEEHGPTTGVLTLTNVPTRTRRTGVDTESFKARKIANFAERDAANRTLGLAGEYSVIQYERHRLSSATADRQIADILHVSKEEGDGAGYDICSSEIDGTRLYIEVKTTTGGLHSDFFISSNEIAFWRRHQDNFALYRVYEFSQFDGSGKLYILRGNPDDVLTLKPLSFRASI